MALAKNKNVTQQDGDILSLKQAAAKIYKGSMCKINAAGYLAPCAPEAGSSFAGVAVQASDNSGGNAGDIEGLVFAKPGECFEFAASGMAQSDVNSKVYATDDETVTTTEGTTSKQVVGNIVKVISATKVLVKITPFAGTGASA